MKIFLAIILTLSTHVHAQRSIGRESFMVNVKPALNSILNDFYQMIELFPEFPKNMTGILKELDSLTIDTGFASSIQALETDSKLLVFSNYKMGEVEDNFKFNPTKWK